MKSEGRGKIYVAGACRIHLGNERSKCHVSGSGEAFQFQKKRLFDGETGPMASDRHGAFFWPGHGLNEPLLNRSTQCTTTLFSDLRRSSGLAMRALSAAG